MTSANWINGIRIKKKGHGNHTKTKEMRHMFTHIFSIHGLLCFSGRATRHITSHRGGFSICSYKGEGEGGVFQFFSHSTRRQR